VICSSLHGVEFIALSGSLCFGFCLILSCRLVVVDKDLGPQYSCASA
jgi:hypothetical protein